MTCQNCGANVEGNFCPVCGTPRAAGATYPPQQAQQQPYSQQPYAPQPVAEPYRPITRKWWFWVLIVVTLIALFITSQMLAPDALSTDSGTTLSEAQLPDNESVQDSDQEAVVPPAKDDITNPFGAATSGALPSIEKTVLLDKDGILVTATGLTEEEWMGPEISVLIENNTDRPITVQALDVSINGIMVSPLFFCDVAAGKKSNETIDFYQTDLDNMGISTIQSIELKLEALDSDDWESIVTGDVVTLRTDAPEQQQVLDTSGTPALNQDGLEVTVRGVKAGDSTWGPEIQLLLRTRPAVTSSCSWTTSPSTAIWYRPCSPSISRTERSHTTAFRSRRKSWIPMGLTPSNRWSAVLWSSTRRPGAQSFSPIPLRFRCRTNQP